jgi:hypothetical protein
MDGKHLAHHPAALVVRFLLELASLAAFGFWAWHSAPDALRWIAAIALPAAAAVAWGVFAVPDDPSRSGRAPVPTPGPIRLLLEVLVFFGSAVALAAAGARTLALAYAIVLALYHVAAHARIRWLLRAR